MRLFGNLMDKPMFCCCTSQSDDDGEILGFSLGFYFLPSTIFPLLVHFAPFLVPIAALPVALSSSLDVSISPFCSLGCSPLVAKPLPSSCSVPAVLLLLHLAEAPGWGQPECIGRHFWLQLLCPVLQRPQLDGRCHEQRSLAQPHQL